MLIHCETTGNALRLVVINASGLSHHLVEMERAMATLRTDICFISEIWMCPRTRLGETRLLVLRNDQAFQKEGTRRAHQGLAFLD